MSTSTEDRLRAALNARADQLRPEDLRPLDAPQPTGKPWSGVGGYALLAAAACAAVVASSIVIGELETRDSPGPATAPSVVGPSTDTVPSKRPVPTAKPEGKLTVKRQLADVDGDGTADQVRLQYRASNHEVRDGLVAVALSSGGTTEADIRPVWPPSLLAPLDLGNDGGSEILVRDEGGDRDTLWVFTLSQGRLVEAVKPDSPLLAGGWDDDNHSVSYWFDEGELFSYRALRPIHLYGANSQVELFSWSLQGTRLVATSLGERCVRSDVSAEACSAPELNLTE